MNGLWEKPAYQYAMITAGTVIMAVGVYFFKFPNNFCFGGVTGVAVVLGAVSSWSPGMATFILNMTLLAVGLVFLGKKFAQRTVYASVLMSAIIWLLELLRPLPKPLTGQPVLEFALAIFLPSIGSAILFNIGASGGGTDILALIVKKYTGFNAGTALLAVDCFITAAAFVVFDIQTGLFAVTGLFVKTFVINSTIESLNMSKYFNVICDNPEKICRYINEDLHRGATVCQAKGAFTNKEKSVVFTALRRSQAVRLRNYIKRVEPGAFIMITNSSEIIGKGFQE